MWPERGRCTVLLLAAGRGLRMGDLTREIPKALIPVDGGRSILDINLEHVRLSITDPHVTVVGGHGWTRLQAYCAERQLPVQPHPILNPDYATAGPARSILTGLGPQRAEAELLLVANGDTLFSAAMLTAAASVETGACLFVSHTPLAAADDLLVSLDGNGKVEAANKGDGFRGMGLISSGLLAVRGTAAKMELLEALEDICAAERTEGKFLPWHAVMARLAMRGTPATARRVDRGHWAEFDTTSCIKRYKSEWPTADVFDQRPSNPI